MDEAQASWGGFTTWLISLLIIAVVGGVIWIVMNGNSPLDMSGWQSHHFETSVTFERNRGWMVGETRICSAGPVGKTIAFLDCRGYGIWSERVGDQREHQFDVHFWGRIERPDTADRARAFWNWKCKREQNGLSLTCWALN